MRCESVRERLADYASGRSGSLERARVRSHLRRCEICASALRAEEELDGLLAEWKGEDPPEAVWLRIRESIHDPFVTEDVPVRLWDRLRVGLVRYGVPYALGAATAAVLLVSVLAAAPGGETSRPEPSARPEAVRLDETGRPALLQGEESLGREGILVNRDENYRRIIEQLRAEGLLRDDVRVAPRIQPASFDSRTH